MSKDDFVTREEFDKFSEREQKIRHKQNNDVQHFIMSPKECTKEKEIALLQQEDTHIMQALKDIKIIIKSHMENEEKSMDNIHKSIEDLRSEIKIDYVTKAEHKESKEKLQLVIKIIWSIIAFVFVGLGTILLNLILNTGT